MVLKNASAIFWKVIFENNTFEKVFFKLKDIYDVAVDKLSNDLNKLLKILFENNIILINGNKFTRTILNSNKLSADNMEYVDYSLKNYFPRSIQIELTKKCNERCIHCYISENNNYELNTKEWFNLLDNLSEMGCGDIIFTGGELFTRKDSMDILRYARKKLMHIDIFSNLTLLSNDMIDEISYLNTRSVQASLYANTSDIHDSITSINGSFNKTFNALKRFINNGTQVAVKFPLMKNNVSCLDSMKKLEKELGFILQIDPTITVKLDGNKTPLNYRLDDKEILEKIMTRKDINFIFDEEKPRAKRDIIASEIICGAGLNSMYITSDGYVWPCVAFPMKVGNIKKNNIKTIWQSSEKLNQWRSYKWNDVEKCNTCDNASLCNFCPGISYVEHSSPLIANDSACRLTSVYADKLNISKGVSNEKNL